MSESAKKRKRTKQFIITFTPFFILTLLFIGFNFWPGWLNQINQQTATQVDSIEETNVVRQPELVEKEQIDVETAVTSIPISTTIPQPTLPPNTIITLNGPPEASSFPGTNHITFYWNWPLAIADNQQFALTIINGEQEQQIGTLNEQNLGQQYALTVNLETMLPAKPESSLFWRINLINSETGSIVAQSERRAFSLISQAAQ